MIVLLYQGDTYVALWDLTLRTKCTIKLRPCTISIVIPMWHMDPIMIPNILYGSYYDIYIYIWIPLAFQYDTWTLTFFKGHVALKARASPRARAPGRQAGGRARGPRGGGAQHPATGGRSGRARAEDLTD